MKVYQLKYLGNTLDEAFELSDIKQKKADLVRAIWNNEAPNFLGPDDFEDYYDCVAAFKIVQIDDGE